MCLVLPDGLLRSDLVSLNHKLNLESTTWSKRALMAPLGEQDSIPTNVDFQSFLKEAAKKSDDLIESLAKKKLKPREWADSFKELLNDGHASAWILGRRLSGDLSEATGDDELVGIAYADTQADFLLSFLDDLDGDRYLDADGNLKVGAVRQRANLYIQVMRGTSGAAFAQVSDPKEEFDWDLNDAVEEHCEDCPYLASKNPWESQELFAYPGDGNTECLGNCRCRLIRKSDDRASFDPVSL